RRARARGTAAPEGRQERSHGRKPVVSCSKSRSPGRGERTARARSRPLLAEGRTGRFAAFRTSAGLVAGEIVSTATCARSTRTPIVEYSLPLCRCKESSQNQTAHHRAKGYQHTAKTPASGDRRGTVFCGKLHWRRLSDRCGRSCAKNRVCAIWLA